MRPYLILFSSWLLPGLGHFMLKRRLKALVFFCGIVILLVLGLLMGGKFYTRESLHPLLLLGLFADFGNGLFYFAIKLAGLAAGDIRAETFHYGTTYLAGAGLLNYLVALNAFDIARGKKP